MQKSIDIHEAWTYFETQYSKLCMFAAGFANVYCGTMGIESDFSVISWKKDEYILSLMDLSLDTSCIVSNSKKFKPFKIVVIFFMNKILMMP